jgi:hypothetical protein
MTNILQKGKKKVNPRRVYIVTKGITRVVYSNIKSISEKEKLNYWKIYRQLSKTGIYAEENVFIERKPILK